MKVKKINPIGQITIIKTLIISKLNHPILALPNHKPEHLVHLVNSFKMHNKLVLIWLNSKTDCFKNTFCSVFLIYK